MLDVPPHPFLKDNQNKKRWKILGWTLCFLALGLLEMNIERKAVNETMRTATQASTCCQKISQTRSNESTEVRMPETLTIATMIIKTLKHKNAPMPSFWRSLMRTFQRRAIGIVITRSVSVQFSKSLGFADARCLLQYPNISPKCQQPKSVENRGLEDKRL